MYERHRFLSDWLITLGVEEKTATEDACRMEHVISAETFEAIKKHVKGQS
jgi:DtxR family Mn-dependent transcriptional regulator